MCSFFSTTTSGRLPCDESIGWQVEVGVLPHQQHSQQLVAHLCGATKTCRWWDISTHDSNTFFCIYIRKICPYTNSNDFGSYLCPFSSPLRSSCWCCTWSTCWNHHLTLAAQQDPKEYWEYHLLHCPRFFRTCHVKSPKSCTKPNHPTIQTKKKRSNQPKHQHQGWRFQKSPPPCARFVQFLQLTGDVGIFTGGAVPGSPGAQRKRHKKTLKRVMGMSHHLDDDDSIDQWIDESMNQWMDELVTFKPNCFCFQLLFNFLAIPPCHASPSQEALDTGVESHVSNQDLSGPGKDGHFNRGHNKLDTEYRWNIFMPWVSNLASWVLLAAWKDSSNKTEEPKIRNPKQDSYSRDPWSNSMIVGEGENINYTPVAPENGWLEVGRPFSLWVPVTFQGRTVKLQVGSPEANVCSSTALIRSGPIPSCLAGMNTTTDAYLRHSWYQPISCTGIHYTFLPKTHRLLFQIPSVFATPVAKIDASTKHWCDPMPWHVRTSHEKMSQVTIQLVWTDSWNYNIYI